MMTKDEGEKIRNIKSRVLNRQPVSATEKQWVLDMLKREQLPVRAEVKQAAMNSGFDVNGICIK